MAPHSKYKPSTGDRYFKVVTNAIDYIDANASQPLSLRRIAAAVGMSPYHFSRVFHEISGETVNDCVNRMKLEYAANMLLCTPDFSIGEIAEWLGFSSSANFSKSFKRHFGMSPSQFRTSSVAKSDSASRIVTQYDMTLDLSRIKSLVNIPDSFKQVQPHLKCIESMDIATLPSKTLAAFRSERGYELEAMREAWQRITMLGKWLEIDTEKQRLFALTYDSPLITPSAFCRYDAAIEIRGSAKTVPSPYRILHMDGGKFAIFNYQGDLDNLYVLCNYLYTAWLPSRGFYAGRCPVIEFIDSSPDFINLNIKIYVKLLHAQPAIEE